MADEWMTTAEAIAYIMFRADDLGDEVRGLAGIRFDTTVIFYVSDKGEPSLTAREACSALAAHCLRGGIEARGTPTNSKAERSIAAREWVDLGLNIQNERDELSYRSHFKPGARGDDRELTGFSHPSFCRASVVRIFSVNADASGAAPNPYRNGMQGRPTSKHLVVTELERRWQAGERHKGLAAWSVELSKWLASAHKQGAQMKSRSVENAIRDRYNQLRPNEHRSSDPIK